MSRLNLEIILGSVLTFFTAFILIVYGLNEQNRMTQAEVNQHAQAVEVGASLFESNCSGCHGLKGEGLQYLCPPLNDVHFFTDRLREVGWTGTLEDYVVSTVSSGRVTSTRPDQYAGQGVPAMPAWSEHYGGPLRDDQIRSIAAFVMNWQATAMGEVTIEQLPSQPPGAAEVQDPVTRGQQVYLSNACFGCHTIEGLSTGTVGPILTQIGTVSETRIPGMAAVDYIRESILNPGAFVVEGYPDQVMPATFGEQLSQQQIDDLVAFLMSKK